MMKALLIVPVLVSLVYAACYSPPKFGPQNLFPILDGNSNAELISTVKNGKLYQVTVPNSGGNTTSTFNVVHIYGSAYEMGRAQGELLKETLPQFITRTWNYFEETVEDAVPWLPTWFSEMIALVGLDAALDATYLITKEYTPDHYYDEIRGICDVTGADYMMVVRVHMIAGLTQGACSMFGMWGDVLADNTKVLQLRALDWDMKGPFRDFPQITVYHPNQGHAFANIGLSGFIGGLTGMSEARLGISEIGAGYPDSTFGSESRIGLPFIFLLRDILQFDLTVDDAINRMINARRTCDLMLGVGDGKLGYFRGMEYSYSVLDVFDDKNLRPDNSSWHPRIKDVVYWGMDWDCPSYNYVLSTQIKKFYGKITPEIAIRYLTAVEMSGDNHIAFYDLTDGEFYVSFAAQFDVGGPTGGYARQFTKFNATALFKETA